MPSFRRAEAILGPTLGISWSRTTASWWRTAPPETSSCVCAITLPFAEDMLPTEGYPYNGDNERHLPLTMRRKLSRTVRLLELMVRVQAKPRFTAAELAKEFGVSRRTILRDLQALSGMGVPLRSTPGPGGGYSLPRGGRRLSPSLTVDEALGLIVSYEALLRYPVHPFSSEGI